MSEVCSHLTFLFESNFIHTSLQRGDRRCNESVNPFQRF